MTECEWKPGDKALLPVVVDAVDVGMDRVVRVSLTGTPYTADVDPEDLIPDDRRPSWLPGQPGDVAEWGGHRWSCARRPLRGTQPTTARSYWVCLTTPVERVGDDDVPADARLLLPARTREVTS